MCNLGHFVSSDYKQSCRISFFIFIKKLNSWFLRTISFSRACVQKQSMTRLHQRFRFCITVFRYSNGRQQAQRATMPCIDWDIADVFIVLESFRKLFVIPLLLIYLWNQTKTPFISPTRFLGRTYIVYKILLCLYVNILQLRCYEKIRCRDECKVYM